MSKRTEAGRHWRAPGDEARGRRPGCRGQVMEDLPPIALGPALSFCVSVLSLLPPVRILPFELRQVDGAVTGGLGPQLTALKLLHWAWQAGGWHRAPRIKPLSIWNVRI